VTDVDSDPGFEVEADAMGVRAWCDEPIPFDGLSDAARGLRARLRESLASLEPEIDEVLHATFSGRLRPGSDVENVLLYNIDQGQAVFGAATRFGVLFERSERVAPAAPSGRAWACGYEYRLVPYPGSFREWAWAYLLANFANVPIVVRGSELSAGAVWKALHDARVTRWCVYLPVTSAPRSAAWTAWSPHTAAASSGIRAMTAASPRASRSTTLRGRRCSPVFSSLPSGPISAIRTNGSLPTRSGS
jgi:hypothetical protein